MGLMGIRRWIDMKAKGCEPIECWTQVVTLNFDLTHDFELGFSRSNCFSRSFIKFQGHTVKKITDFDPNWPFPDCNSSLTSPIALK